MSFKLLILQSDPLEATNTAHNFVALGCEVVAMEHQAQRVLQAVQQHQPDAVIMDAFMANVNCDEIAHQLTYSYHQPLVKLALGNCRNDVMASRFMDQGGDHYLITPPDYHHCLHLIDQTLTLRKKQIDALPSPVRLCTERYQTLLGIPPSLKGYLYIQDAVELASQQRNYLYQLTTALYPAVGLLYRSSGTAVERAIRAAIDHVFEKGNLPLLEEYFRAYIRSDTGKTSAGDFLFVLTRLVCRDLGIKM